MDRRFDVGFVGRCAVLLACVGGLPSLGAAARPAASASSHSVLASYATGAGPVSVALGDLNGDGKPDLATANLYANTVSVFLDQGGGSVGPRRDYRAGGDPRAVAIGDLNGDGSADLAAVSGDADVVSVFLNKGDGVVGKRRDYETGAGPLSLAIGDLNGDRKKDIAAVGRSYRASVVLNGGGARFKLTRQAAVGREPVSVAIADLNGDGASDLVAANAEANTVSVLLNRGGGRFQTRRDYATGGHPMSVAVGDLSGDGKPELVAANLDSNTISVLSNRGDGSFERRRDYRAGGDPRAVAIGDLNGDRKSDVVTVNADASTVSLLLNQGDGSFPAKRDSVTGHHPVAVAIGDLDGDGSPDVVTANLEANTVSVLRAPDLVAGNEVTPAPPPPAPPAPGLILWNKLGGTYEVTHSEYGPDLTLFDCKDSSTASFNTRCSTDVNGKLAYRQGVFGGAAAIGGGPYFSEARVHRAMLRASILNPEKGTVEVWYRQAEDPVPLKHDQYRMFGGCYSLVGVDEISLCSHKGRLHFAVFFGEEPPPYVLAHMVEARSLANGAQGYPTRNLRRRWVHVAGVWDRHGIAGSRDTVRLYVNGTAVAASKDKSWGTTPCGRRVAARPGGACFIDVAGCNDACANAFAVDNLKVWNYAKTDFSDRFIEGP